MENKLKNFEEERLKLEENKKAFEELKTKFEEKEKEEKEKKLLEIEKEKKEKLIQENQQKQELEEEKEKIKKEKEKLEEEHNKLNEKNQKHDEDTKKLEEDRKKLEDYQKQLENEKKLLEENEKSIQKKEEIMLEKESIKEEKLKLEEQKVKFREDKLAQEEKELEQKRKELKDEIEKDKKSVEEEKQKINIENIKVEEDKKLIEKNKKEIEEEKKIIDEKNKRIEEEKQEMEKERKKIEEIKDALEKEKKSIEETKKNLEEEKIKQEAENKKILNEKEKLEKMEKERIKIEKLKINNNKRESYSNYGKNSNEQSDRYSNNPKTIKDSDLEKEVININETNNKNEIIEIENNYINGNIDDNNIKDYQKLYDKEVSNKLKYELQKDLLNRQKKGYNLMLLTNLKNKSQDMKNLKIKNLMDLKNNGKKNKLTLSDLENDKDKKIKEMEILLKGGIDENKLKKLENIYKDNKEIIIIINKYKAKKSNLENNNNLFDDSVSYSEKMENKNVLHKSKSNLDVNILRLKNNKIIRGKSAKKSYYFSSSLGNQNYNNQSASTMQDFLDLSPFYYISNGNKYSKNMWGYNDKSKIMNPIGLNRLTHEQIFRNKIKIYKDKMYQPFYDKIEKEKNKEYKRIQILRSINDPGIKQNLETKYGIERGKIDLELKKERAKINKAIKQYENDLLINDSENIKFIEQNNIFFDL